MGRPSLLKTSSFGASACSAPTSPLKPPARSTLKNFERLDSIEVTGSFSCRVPWLSGFPSFESSVYELYGNKWQLRVYPYGALTERSDYVEIQLMNKTNKDINASYVITLKNQTSGDDVVWEDPDGQVLFRPDGTGDHYWGCDDFMLRSELADPSTGFCRDGCIVLVVEVTARIENALGAITPTTVSFNENGEQIPGACLGAATNELNQLSTKVKHTTRLISEDEVIQDQIIKARLKSTSYCQHG